MTTLAPPYSGSLTAEQFLFYEIRIVANLYLQNYSLIEIIEKVSAENAFQYPTEREVSRITRACYKRIIALNNVELVQALLRAPYAVAKQINLYAMMRQNRLVLEFMIHVIGEKYRVQEFTFSKKDIHVFFNALREQNDTIAKWSDKTVAKIKQVLMKCLVETQYLDTVKALQLNHIQICEELECGIRKNNDLHALPAFNCFY